MPAIRARTAPAEITLISAAFAAVASSVTTVASTEARARLMAFLPCSFLGAMAQRARHRMDRQFKGVGAPHKRVRRRSRRGGNLLYF
jgi:hypothetical protein